ncbi:MAG: hypothetical protein NT083_00335 [Rhodocyclales bacterium]|nr:hypothetical protein [Rhodocyclales bacterium]
MTDVDNTAVGAAILQAIQLMTERERGLSKALLDLNDAVIDAVDLLRGLIDDADHVSPALLAGTVINLLQEAGYRAHVAHEAAIADLLGPTVH